MAAAMTVRLADLPAWAEAEKRRLAGINYGPLIRILMVIARADVMSRFDEQRAPDGTPWRALAFPRIRGGSKALLDRGLLRASIQAVYAEGGFTVGTAHVSATVHQDGAVITPKRGTYLAIPKTRDAQRAGSPRRFPRPLSPRIGPRGGVLVEERKGKEIVHYILARKVVIPARPFIGISAKGGQDMDVAALDWIERQAIGA